MTLLRLAAGLAVVMAVGCATPAQRGDRAYASGNFDAALTYYEEAIDDGSRDPQVFFRAAKAATRAGQFAVAERYYSRALRYGGGPEVARALADFYIRTSNYVSAVRVLQYLLGTDVDPQPIYNNLGTALMYAGEHLDAESYLLVAQQMAPTDPVPYVNLGLLYDEHFNRPQLALAFYRCYLDYGSDKAQIRKVRQRVAELERQYGGAVPEAYDVTCGEPYGHPAAPDRATVRAEMEALKAMEQSEKERAARQGPVDLGLGSDDAEGAAGQEEAPAQPPRIERQVEDVPAPPAPGQATTDAKATLARAKQAFADGDYAAAVDLFESLPVRALDARAEGVYGRALVEVGRNEDARQWLRGAVDRRPTPETVAALATVYRRLDQSESLAELCDRFAAVSELAQAIEDCPNAAAGPEPKTLERLEKKQDAATP